MQIYDYDPETGEYIGERTANPSPMEPGKFLVPKYSTRIKPPIIKEREVACFREGWWQILRDWRGEEVYNTETRERSTIEEIDIYPDGVTLTQTPPGGHDQWVDGAWQKDEDAALNDAKALKVIEINQRAEQAILAGFSSSALGDEHLYDSLLEDQVNLLGSVLTGVDMPFRCAPALSPNMLDFLPHTADQLKQVLSDGATRKLAILAHASALKLSLERMSVESDVLELVVSY